MHPEALALLRCPVCRRPLEPRKPLEPRTEPGARADEAPGRDAARSGGVCCPAEHSFDVARQGYLALTAGRRIPHGDTAAMVADRVRFLAGGHFDPLTRALVDAVPPDPAGAVLDAGAGTGHHLAAVLAARPGAVGLALDASRYALRRAARAHPRAQAVLCDIWGHLPVADRCASAILDVFAPRNGAEFARILRPEGVLVVAVPGPDHLTELVGALGLLRVDPDKDHRTPAALAPLVPAGSRQVRWTMALSRDQVAAAAGMGPSARHTTPAALADRIAELAAPVAVTAQVTVARYRLPPMPR